MRLDQKDGVSSSFKIFNLHRAIQFKSIDAVLSIIHAVANFH